ncbi:MAG: tRNA (adenosine(37)-N6)-threonylcarbamoyltransferase complex transferase subunit TsaD [Desulfobacterales bacterium]|nr:tRNA (adenosine(37)-N6)-threonylcarbamoyltransferase complex transferase subunit TsaD [Desulfobacterales bacterium]
MLVLGIETSCDETSASVVADGKSVISSIIASQVEAHHPYGGVVPEIASRKHIEYIVSVVNEALIPFGIQKKQLAGIAVTQGPGLIGSLLVGLSFAKAFAYGLSIPWIGVNHLIGHIHSVFLEPECPQFPFVALLVSGGHTIIYHVTDYLTYDILGTTLDDACGEAFDKVSKMLGCGYPGGTIIGQLAEKGNPNAIQFPRTFIDKSNFDFSFSGIKTAVSRYIQTHPNSVHDELFDISASFQEAVVDVLTYKILHAARVTGCRSIAIVGGVAANTRLRQKVTESAIKENIHVFVPSIKYCGDNAAMIAALGYHYLINGESSCFDHDVYTKKKSKSL